VSARGLRYDAASDTVTHRCGGRDGSCPHRIELGSMLCRTCRQSVPCGLLLDVQAAWDEFVRRPDGETAATYRRARAAVLAATLPTHPTSCAVLPGNPDGAGEERAARPAPHGHPASGTAPYTVWSGIAVYDPRLPLDGGR
jgi:hypothetical protein